MDKQFQKWVIEDLKELSVELSDLQAEQFYQYYKLLIEWNKVMNLTAITEMRDVISKHFADSLSLVKAIPDLSECSDIKLLDLGTGAGFPGLPLKIVFPKFRITLLDSLNKRIKFLNEVIDTIGLKNVDTIHGRAEDLGRNVSYRESYDICVSRAVANLATLSEYCLPFVKISGCFISYKSEKIEEEVEQAKKALKLLGGRVEKIVNFQLPGTDAGRSLIVIKKINKTPEKYPRKAGLPGKEPLY